MVVGHLAHHAQALRVVDMHAAGSLEQRFDDDPGELVGVRRGQRTEPRGPVGHVACVGRRSVGEHLRVQDPREQRVHAPHGVAHAHRAERVAVVAAADGEHPRALRTTDPALVLEDHLEGDLHADRARVGQEHVLEPGGRDLDEPLGQPHRRGVGQATEHDVGEVVDLGVQGRIQRGVAVAVDRGPPRRHAVDHVATVGETQPDALGARHEPGRRRVGHRGVRMPDVLAVEREQVVGAGQGHRG